jgi:hypothetical protein
MFSQRVSYFLLRAKKILIDISLTLIDLFVRVEMDEVFLSE